MKGEKFFSALCAWVIAFCVSFGAVACVVTAFSLEGAEMLPLAVFCALFCGVVAVCLHVRWGSAVLLGMLALSGGYLLREGSLLLQTEALVSRITTFYDGGYGCGILRWSGAALEGVPVTLALQVVAAVTVLPLLFALCRRKRVLLAVPAALIPVFSCVVVTDTVPEDWCLFLVLFGIFLLILTNALRRRAAHDGVRLTALLLIPALLASMLLFGSVPRDGYESQTHAVQQTLLNLFPNLPFLDRLPNGDVVFNPGSTVALENVDLASVGPRARMTFPVMDVTADQSGTVYLRGQAFDTYDGKSWQATQTMEYLGFWPRSEDLVNGGTLRISTRLSQSLRYFPYYPVSGDWQEQLIQSGGWSNLLVKGKIDNTEDPETGELDTVYSYTLMLPDGSRSEPIIYSNIHVDAYLQLPDATRDAAQEILRENGLYDAETIRAYVESRAEYDLNTPRMSPDSEDFAIWFLTRSDTGYCVHFASAAVVLLRAAGIPARYVTGYMAQVEAGQSTVVTMDKAHAWVEYLDPYFGWRVLEATPPMNEEQAPPATEPSGETQATEPPARETEPAQPTQTATSPTEDTRNPGGNPPSGGADWTFLWNTLAVLGTLAAVTLLLWGQYRLRRHLRQRRTNKLPPNLRALARWQEVCRVCRVLKTQPPKELRHMAERARFSQHTLTPAELVQFRQYLNRAEAELQKLPLLKRLAVKLIWAV